MGVANSLEAESFFCAFSCFTVHGGGPKGMYSDNGPYFVGVSRIFKQEFAKIQTSEAQKNYDRLGNKQDQISTYLLPLNLSSTHEWSRSVNTKQVATSCL